MIKLLLISLCFVINSCGDFSKDKNRKSVNSNNKVKKSQPIRKNTRRSKKANNKQIIVDLTSERDSLMLELNKLKKKHSRLKNTMHGRVNYKDVIKDVLELKLQKDIEKIGLNPEHLSTKFYDLYNIEYTNDEIIVELEEVIIKHINFFANSLEFNYDAISTGDTTQNFIEFKKS